MSKIIFLDVDGTLIDYEAKLPDSAVQAIRAARNNGHRVYICTGRSRAEVYSELWDIGLDGMIGGNGSYVEDHNHVVMHQHISEQDCRRLVDWMQQNDLDFYLECNSGLYASPYFGERSLPYLQAYASGKGMEAHEVSQKTVLDFFPDMIFGASVYRDDVNKISFCLKEYRYYLEAKEKFSDFQVGTWGGKGETALFGDFGVKGITKGNAIQHLLDYLGADRKDTIAFGDAKVDIPMFEYCEISVAMGGAGEEAKEAADYITDTVEADGLKKAFERLHLI